MKKYHLFLPLLGILLLVSGGCSKRKEPKPLITEAPAVETEIGGYITETESSTPESQSVSGTIRLPIQEPEHQNESVFYRDQNLENATTPNRYQVDDVTYPRTPLA